ncbi:muscarinic acetylcholine receptor M1-like isoform X2 [Symsagittifera roscoffensis]|uniref:muscarinic acetylcholine receptor M1-like isoform X2 n=1 Tax=Symsagittifera roscoffensis TaxID=84072 RepID=UPI00307B80E2
MANSSTLFDESEFDQLVSPISTDFLPLKPGLWALALCVFVPLCIATITGNILVLVAFRRERKLRTVTNYFLVSLAVSDLIIGLISMPLYSIYVLKDETWIFHENFCTFYLCVDYTVSGASALHLLLISLDRYLSISRPLRYRPERTARRVLVAIAVVWLVPFVTWAPSIVLWPIFNPSKHHLRTEGIGSGPRTCFIRFLDDFVAAFATSVWAFYLPVIIMVFLYVQIWWITYTRARKFMNEGQQGLFHKSTVKSTRNEETTNSRNRLGTSDMDIHGRRTKSENQSPTDLPRRNLTISTTMAEGTLTIELENGTAYGKVLLTPNLSSVRRNTDDNQSSAPHSCVKLSDSVVVSESNSTPIATLDGRSNHHRDDRHNHNRDKNGSGRNGSNKKSHNKQRPLQINKSGAYAISGMCGRRGGPSGDRKAARVLSLIAAAFILTWTPYNVLVILQAFGLNVTPFVWTFFYWLCYLNSTLNPICYGVANETFRNTFIDILKCRKPRRKHNAVLTSVRKNNTIFGKKGLNGRSTAATT